MRWSRVVALTAFSFSCCTAQAASFTGLWKLNVAKSSWSGKQPPVIVIVQIDYTEPFLKYSGTAVDVHGDGRDFEFSGVTDGKERSMIRSGIEGKVVVERLGPYVIVKTFKSKDETVVERTRMTLSRDSKTLTYQVQLTEGDRQTRWTEVYER